jgi:hypothetical protein
VTKSVTDAALRGRIGGLANSAKNDPKVYTSPARAAFLAGFLAQVDPDGVLPLAERQRRADQALKAYMARLTRLRTLSRRKGTA